MKRRCYIGILFVGLALTMACNPKGTSLEPVGVPSHALSTIDSLMWQQPDSAFSQLLQYADTAELDSLDAFDRNYFQLLVAELLYKNDYAQSNRTELQQAVAYYDSLNSTLADNSRPVFRHCGPDPQSPSLYDLTPFLSARAHYINGVGYYENDSVVAACAEYLKALEVMEDRFEEKELVGKRAQFMAYTYNRLGDLFEEQLSAESAIACYKQALTYCRREPTSKYGISIVLYSIGIQFDVSGQIDSAYFYYDKALVNLPDNDNIHYRDIMSTKALLAYYSFGICSDSIIRDLKHIISLSTDEDERTTRLLTLGNILFDDKQYDSSRFYLETLFEQEEDVQSKILAAENLCKIYQLKGDSLKVWQYSSFLADYTIKEIEKKSDFSKINEMFNGYLTKKQQKQAEIGWKKSVKKALVVFVMVAFVVFIIVKRKSQKLLKNQQKESDKKIREIEQQHKEVLKQRLIEAEKILKDKEKHYQIEIEAKEAKAKKELDERDKRHAEAIEAERQTHRMEQAAMSGKLKRRNQEVRELKDQIKQLDDLTVKNEFAASFYEEPICRLIMDRVNEGKFKSKIDYIVYKDFALDKQQLLNLRLAVDRHFGQFTTRLKKNYPELTNSDFDYCCLYLLGLTDADIAALMQRTYNTVFERNVKLRRIFSSENPLSITLLSMAKDSLFV